MGAQGAMSGLTGAQLLGMDAFNDGDDAEGIYLLQSTNTDWLLCSHCHCHCHCHYHTLAPHAQALNRMKFRV